MIFRDCPTCKGKRRILSAVPNHKAQMVPTEVPCPTCTDSEGEPQGRGLYLSVAEITIIADSLWASGHKIPSGVFHEERAMRRAIQHRSNPGKGGSMICEGCEKKEAALCYDCAACAVGASQKDRAEARASLLRGLAEAIAKVPLGAPTADFFDMLTTDPDSCEQALKMALTGEFKDPRGDGRP